MTLVEMLRFGGAAGAVYFLVTMLLALINEESSASARAWGLGLCLLAMAFAGIIEIQPPIPLDPALRPTRMP